VLRDNVFSLPSYYTRTEIELIIQHFCRSDPFRSLYCMFAIFLCVSLYVCSVCTKNNNSNKLILSPRAVQHVVGQPWTAFLVKILMSRVEAHATRPSLTHITSVSTHQLAVCHIVRCSNH